MGVPGVLPDLKRALRLLRLTRAAWLPIVPGALGWGRSPRAGREAEMLLQVPGAGVRASAALLSSRLPGARSGRWALRPAGGAVPDDVVR